MREKILLAIAFVVAAVVGCSVMDSGADVRVDTGADYAERETTTVVDSDRLDACYRLGGSAQTLCDDQTDADMLGDFAIADDMVTVDSRSVELPAQR